MNTAIGQCEAMQCSKTKKMEQDLYKNRSVTSGNLSMKPLFQKNDL